MFVQLRDFRIFSERAECARESIWQCAEWNQGNVKTLKPFSSLVTHWTTNWWVSGSVHATWHIKWVSCLIAVSSCALSAPYLIVMLIAMSFWCCLCRSDVKLCHPSFHSDKQVGLWKWEFIMYNDSIWCIVHCSLFVFTNMDWRGLWSSSIQPETY